MLLRSVVVPVLLTCLLPHAVAQAGIRWTPSLDQALAAAKAENKVLLLAFHLVGERASDEHAADHYLDATLAKLAQATVNVFCSVSSEPAAAGVTVAQQQAAESAARLQVLKVGPGEDVQAPQHVFVGPDGTVLSSVPQRVTKGELEWVWVDAIRKVDPKFVWQPSPAARAPFRLVFGEFARGQHRLPPNKAQVAEALKEVKKARGGLLRGLQHVELLMRSDDPEALAFVQTTLKGLQGAQVAAALDLMGAVSPRAYHTVLVSWLGDRDETVRIAAAGALETMAEPKAFASLGKQYKTEKVAAVRGRLLRAMAACGPAQKEAQAQVDKVLQKEPEALARAHAVLALALLEDRVRVQAGLVEALRDGSAKVRSTAAFALAWRRDGDCAHRLDEAASREEDAEAKAWIVAAAAVVRGGSSEPFARFLERELGESPLRTGFGRFFGGDGGRGAGGRGAGGAGGGTPGGGTGGG